MGMKILFMGKKGIFMFVNEGTSLCCAIDTNEKTVRFLLATLIPSKPLSLFVNIWRHFYMVKTYKPKRPTIKMVYRLN